MAERSFLLFRNGSIGNTLMAVPAIRAIRRAFPDAEIAIVVDSIGHELLEHCPYVDRVIVFDKVSGQISLGKSLRVLKAVRACKPTHAVLFKRFYRNGLMAWLSGAKIRVGFETDGSSPFLNRTVPYDLTTHIAHLNLKLAALVGAHSEDDSLEVFLSDDDECFAQEWRARNALRNDPYVCAHYGGVSVGSKFMPLESFAEFLRVRLNNYPVVFIGSGDREAQDANALHDLLPNSLVALDLPLRYSIAIMKTASAFAGFNSGPAHLAAACKLPGMVIFPDDVFRKDGVRWRPLHDDLLVLAAGRKLSEREWAEWIANSPRLIQ